MSGSDQTETGLALLLRGPSQQDDQSVPQAQLNDLIANPVLGSEEQANYMQVRDDEVRNKLQEIFSMVYAQTTSFIPQNVGTVKTSRATDKDTQANTPLRTSQGSPSDPDPAAVFEHCLRTLTPLLKTRPGSHRSFVEWATSKRQPYARPNSEQAVEFPVSWPRTGPVAQYDLSLQEALQSCDSLLSRAFVALETNKIDAAMIYFGEIGVKMNGHWDTSLMHPEQANETRSMTSPTDCPTAAGLPESVNRR